MIITIDGLAGSGKTTISKQFAKEYHWNYLNSGAFYRGITYIALQNADINEEGTISPQHFAKYRDEIIPSMLWNAPTLTIVSNNTNYELEQELFTPEIDTYVAKISKEVSFREKIITQIQNICIVDNWIIEGRDAGTKIFPNADVKIYLEASLEIRAERRKLQYIDSKDANIPENIVQTIQERDDIDKNKGKYSLTKLKDSYIIDTSSKGIATILEKVYTIVNKHMSAGKNMDNNSQSEKDKEFEQLFESSVSVHLENDNKVQNGAMVEGTVIKVTTEDIFIDIGIKTEGVISVNEFEADSIPNIGDKVAAVVSRRLSDTILLSFSKARGINALEGLAVAYDNKLSISAKVTEQVNGGFVAIIDKNIKAFVPISQIDTVHVSDDQFSNYIGKTFDFLIIQLHKGKHANIVLSRRRLLHNFENKKKEKFFDEKHEGDIVEGVVKTHSSFGVFVDLGGFDGLLHVSDLSWGKNVKPSEIAPKQTTLKLMITKLDKENKKINLSLKALTENPWEHIDQRYSVGQTVTGTVVKILHYGAFVNIEEHIEGFVHISDLSWTKRVHHPKEILKLHSEIECKVLSIDKEQARISLGIKQIETNPWDIIEELYPLGKVVQAHIIKLLKAGCIVELEEGIRGFISRDDYAWNKSKEPKLSEGDEVECKVVNYNLRIKEVKLGIKQLSENPWGSNELKVGTVVEGIISSVTDFGVFVKINNDIEGLIPKSQSYDSNEASSFEEVKHNFKKGNTIQAVIQNINSQDQKITLSVREIKESATKQELQKHLIEGDETHSINLGDILNQGDKQNK